MSRSPLTITDEIFFSRLDKARLEGYVGDALRQADDGELYLEYVEAGKFDLGRFWTQINDFRDQKRDEFTGFMRRELRLGLWELLGRGDLDSGPRHGTGSDARTLWDRPSA